jgi:hypothetical protein
VTKEAETPRADVVVEELHAQLGVARLCLAYAEETTQTPRLEAVDRSLDGAMGALDIMDFLPSTAADERVARFMVAEAVFGARAHAAALLAGHGRRWITAGGCC